MTLIVFGMAPWTSVQPQRLQGSTGWCGLHKLLPRSTVTAELAYA